MHTLSDLNCMLDPKLAMSVSYEPLLFSACFMLCSDIPKYCPVSCIRVHVCFSSAHSRCMNLKKMVVKLHSGAVIQWGSCDLTAPSSLQVTSAIPFHLSCWRLLRLATLFSGD